MLLREAAERTGNESSSNRLVGEGKIQLSVFSVCFCKMFLSTPSGKIVVKCRQSAGLLFRDAKMGMIFSIFIRSGSARQRYREHPQSENRRSALSPSYSWRRAWWHWHEGFG